MSHVLVVFDLLLCGTLVALALSALTSPEPRRGVILFIAFGLLLALVWARLRAPDVAIAEAAIGAGVAGALLLSAARRAARRGPVMGIQQGRCNITWITWAMRPVLWMA